MQQQLPSTKQERFCGSSGFSTLELLLAFSIITISMVAALSLFFVNQSLITDSQNSREALAVSNQTLEDTHAHIQENFFGTFATTVTTSIYTARTVTQDVTPCKKLLTGQITWNNSPLRNQSDSITTAIANIPELFALGGDCGGTEAREVTRWSHVATATPVDIGIGNQATSVDVLNGIVFVGTLGTTTGQSDLFIYQIQNKQLQLLYSLDVGPGINALDVIKNADGNYYIFAASSNTVGPNYNQLLIIAFAQDLASVPQLIAQKTLPGVSGSLPQGNAIVYYNNKLYIATRRTAGNELHVYDVSLPSNPVWKGSVQLNHNVNQIIVRGTTAYIAASGNTKDLMVLDVSNPTAISIVATIDLPGSEDGKSIFLLGNTLFLGRFAGTNATHPDFYALDVTNLAAGISILGSVYLHADVSGIRVSNNTAFLATSDATKEFQIFDVTNIANLLRISSLNLPHVGSGIDYEDNQILISTKGSEGITLITPP